MSEYAYGGNTHDGCPCPAMAAGFHPDGDNDILKVAEQYDEIARTWKSNSRGIISEEEAQEFWQDAIEQVGQLFGEDDTGVEAGQDVAEILDWR